MAIRVLSLANEVNELNFFAVVRRAREQQSEGSKASGDAIGRRSSKVVKETIDPFYDRGSPNGSSRLIFK